MKIGSGAMTLLGVLQVMIGFLLGLQASGAAGIEMFPPWFWILLGTLNAGIGALTGTTNPGTRTNLATAARLLLVLSVGGGVGMVLGGIARALG